MKSQKGLSQNFRVISRETRKVAGKMKPAPTEFKYRPIYNLVEKESSRNVKFDVPGREISLDGRK